MGRSLRFVRSLSLAAILCAAVPGGLSLPAAGGKPDQEQVVPRGDFTIKVNVNLVPVEVTVYGTPARELTAEDFVVYDIKVPQKVIYYSRGQIPLNVALVVDTSGSLAAYSQELQSAARTALGSLKPDDQVVLFGFSTFPARLSELTQDPAQIVRRLVGISSMGTTNIWDALFVAARYLSGSAADRRRAIILISDNGQIISWGQTWKSALRELLEDGVTVYAIETRGSGALYAESDAVRRVAVDSGGQFLDVGTRRSLSDALNQSVSSLRDQYTLGFNPAAAKKDGSFHTLSVRLRNAEICPDCRLHARSGYYDGTPRPSSPAAPEFKTVPPGARVESVVYERIAIAAADMAEQKAIPLEIMTAPGTGITGRLRTRVDVRIDAAKVQFKLSYGQLTARLCVAIFSALSDGVYFSTDWRVLDLQLTEDAYKQVLSSGITHSAWIRGSPSVIKVVACDLQADRLGSKKVTVR